MTETGEDTGRTAPVLSRLTSDDVHRAARALPSKTLQQLARTVGVPISVLTSAGNAADLVRRRARRLDTANVSALGRDLAASCVADTISALGDRHDDPSYEDLLAILEPISARWGVRVVALMLAATADGDFNASAVCARLLDEDARFALDAIGPEQEASTRATIGTSTPTATAGEAEIEAKREQRRQRREAKKAKQPTKRASTRSYRRTRGDAPADTPAEPLADPRAGSPALTVESRPRSTEAAPLRRVTVVGKYDDLRYDDDLVGAVVDAFIPFRDPTLEVEDGKTRPCIVIAACAPESLVVRPCYSEGGARAGDWRSVRVTDPLAAGLDKNSYVSTEEVVVARAEVLPVRGWLARGDWNAL
jgi:hypothetical protein